MKNCICPSRLNTWASPRFSCLNTVCTCRSPILACQIYWAQFCLQQRDTTSPLPEGLFYSRQCKNRRGSLRTESRVPPKAGKRAGDLCSLSQAGIKETLWVAITFPSPSLSELKSERLGEEGSIAHCSACKTLKTKTRRKRLFCWGDVANK